MAQRLLIVDDDTELTPLLGELLGHDGFDGRPSTVGAGAADRAVPGATPWPSST